LNDDVTGGYGVRDWSFLIVVCVNRS
jgi:hypothetical protein